MTHQSFFIYDHNNNIYSDNYLDYKSLDLKKIEFKNSYLFILIITLVMSNYLSFKVLKGSFIEIDLSQFNKNEFSFDKKN